MQESQQQMVSTMLSYFEHAGKLAVENQSKAAQSIKADDTIVTETDLALSKMAHQMLAPFLEREDTLLIDEEAINDVPCTASDVKDYAYTWVLDPIDGTANYAMGLPLYGIMLGVLKDGKPWLGGVYLPAVDELFYCDGDKAYFVKYPFSNKANKSFLPNYVQPTPDKPRVGWDLYNKHWAQTYGWNVEHGKAVIYGASSVFLSWISASRLSGHFCVGQGIWDLVAPWACLNAVGLDFWSYETGKKISSVDDLNLSESWQTQSPLMVGTEHTFMALKTGVIQLKQTELHHAS